MAERQLNDVIMADERWAAENPRVINFNLRSKIGKIALRFLVKHCE